MRVMGDMGDIFSTNVNKVSKEEIQVNVYEWKSPPHVPHHPHGVTPSGRRANVCAAAMSPQKGTPQPLPYGAKRPQLSASGWGFAGVAIEVAITYWGLPA